MDPIMDSGLLEEPERMRSVFPAWLDEHLALRADSREKVRVAVTMELKRCNDDALAEMIKSFFSAGLNNDYYPANHCARRIGRAFSKALIGKPEVHGVERIDKWLNESPVLFVGNHLSYVDSQVTDYIFHDFGAAVTADRLVFIAGPKVYDEPFRRMGTICLNTIKTVQSQHVAKRDSHVPGPMEIARIAKKTIAMAGKMMKEGTPVFLYAEGTRSRDGRLQPFLPAAGRYAEVEHLLVVPVALSGTEELMPVGEKLIRNSKVILRVGEIVEVRNMDGSGALREVWQRINEMLPEKNRRRTQAE